MLRSLQVPATYFIFPLFLFYPYLVLPLSLFLCILPLFNLSHNIAFKLFYLIHISIIFIIIFVPYTSTSTILLSYTDFLFSSTLYFYFKCTTFGWWYNFITSISVLTIPMSFCLAFFFFIIFIATFSFVFFSTLNITLPNIPSPKSSNIS